jgi:hypothetical protein
MLLRKVGVTIIWESSECPAVGLLLSRALPLTGKMEVTVRICPYNGHVDVSSHDGTTRDLKHVSYECLAKRRGDSALSISRYDNVMMDRFCAAKARVYALVFTISSTYSK